MQHMHVPGFAEKRDELASLVKRFRKGDKNAQLRLQELLLDHSYRRVFAATFKGTAEGRALQLLRARREKIQYKAHGSPVQGGAPGLGKRK
jgi:hypothetical protein